MKHVKLLVGNTSSGIIEAASFNKYVLNLGNRQKGRMCGENVIHLPFLVKEIVENAIKYSELTYTGINPYYQPEPSAKIVQCIRNYF